MSAVLAPDPGPLARMEAVVAAEHTPSVVFQRIAEGETLRDVAKAWKVPVGRFTQWFSTVHADLYDAALRVRADQLAHEALDRADGADAETVGPAKLQVDTRLKLASKWDRSRYGESVKIDREITVTADAGLIGLAAQLLDRISRSPEKVIPAEPRRVVADDADLI